MMRKNKSNGFSLVEVVLALGILVFCLVALLGLLPMGIQSFRSAMSMTVESQIAQSLSSDLQLTDFSNLRAGTYYFDDQGMLLSDAPNAADARVIYTATVTLQDLDSPADLPSTAVVNAMIEIVNKSTPNKKSDYSVIVANNNR
ncbi:MAG: Verru_Chthon cassette protein B [Verrucomicrobiales bacterium]|jgi:uncharacterized protein (TIGR02598 family)|nr:Verru_Chthon cassette protein B [Verrucomicrobiales bacterium]